MHVITMGKLTVCTAHQAPKIEDHFLILTQSRRISKNILGKR